MRLRIVFLPVVGMLALSGCQTTKSKAERRRRRRAPSTQSDRLIKLAAISKRSGENDTAIALYQRATAMPDAKPSAFVKAGEAYMRAGYPAEAAQAYQCRAVESAE